MPARDAHAARGGTRRSGAARRLLGGDVPGRGDTGRWDGRGGCASALPRARAEAPRRQQAVRPSGGPRSGGGGDRAALRLPRRRNCPRRPPAPRDAPTRRRGGGAGDARRRLRALLVHRTAVSALRRRRRTGHLRLPTPPLRPARHPSHAVRKDPRLLDPGEGDAHPARGAPPRGPGRAVVRGVRPCTAGSECRRTDAACGAGPGATGTRGPRRGGRGVGRRRGLRPRPPSGSLERAPARDPTHEGGRRPRGPPRCPLPSKRSGGGLCRGRCGARPGLRGDPPRRRRRPPVPPALADPHRRR